MRALLAVTLLGFAAAAIAQVPATPPAPGPAAQTPAPTQAAVAPEALHNELRKMRDDMLAAIARGDFEAILPYLHPNVVFTPMNGEVSRGPQAIRAYFDKMLKAPSGRASVSGSRSIALPISMATRPWPSAAPTINTR